jgi:hypothetical protein
MKIKYVGLKQKCTAFLAETGITWTPGSAYDVDEKMAAKMLRHPDVFAVAEDEMPPAPTAAPTPEPTAAPAGVTLAPGAAVPTLPVVDMLDAMSDEAVRAYAKDQGLKIQGLALTKGANLRAKVLAAMEAKG